MKFYCLFFVGDFLLVLFFLLVLGLDFCVCVGKVLFFSISKCCTVAGLQGRDED